MSIPSEINRLTSSIANAYAAVKDKGGTLPAIQNANNLAAAIRSIPYDPPKIYGVTWDGSTSTKLTRTDEAASFGNPNPAIGTGAGSSPFDNILPWSGMTKVTDATAGTLVKIPRFYYSLTQSGTTLSIKISSSEFDGSYISPAHMDRGDGKGERKEIYVGRYHCNSSYVSAAGSTPVVSTTRANFRTNIAAKGTGIYQFDFTTLFTLWLLYIVEFADWDSQTVIGYGCGGNGSMSNNGYTDSMTYHTGTTTASRTTYGFGTQYRWIEGLWDNGFDYIDGCRQNSSGLYIDPNPTTWADTSGGTLVGLPVMGWAAILTVSSAAGYPMFYSSGKTGGSKTTMLCDYWTYNKSKPCIYHGGGVAQSQNSGMFCMNCSAVGDALATITCRLQKLP